MRYGGYKYDDSTGEFSGVPGAKKKKARSRFHWPSISFPRFSFPRFRLPTFSFPSVRLPRLGVDWSACFGCLGSVLGLLVLLLKYLVVLSLKPLAFVFYPFIKLFQFECEAWREGDWFMMLIWLLPGFFLVAIYRVAFALLLGLIEGAFSSMQVDDSLEVLLVVGGLVTCVVLYLKALTLARRGQLVVYRDWGDFLKSSAWLVVVPLGLEWGLEEGVDWLMHAVGWTLVLVGVCSVLWMVCGAFLYNSGADCWLALFGRIAVTLLLLFSLAKLQEKLEQYKRHELGIIRGVLIPLAVFAAVFNWLIRPMIQAER